MLNYMAYTAPTGQTLSTSAIKVTNSVRVNYATATGLGATSVALPTNVSVVRLYLANAGDTFTIPAGVTGQELFITVESCPSDAYWGSVAVMSGANAYKLYFGAVGQWAKLVYVSGTDYGWQVDGKGFSDDAKYFAPGASVAPVSGLLLSSPSTYKIDNGANTTFTVPTGALLDAALGSGLYVPVGYTLPEIVIGALTSQCTVTGAVGNSIVGTAVIPANKTASVRIVRTGAGAYETYVTLGA
jgi:hypothetical protein